MMRFIVDANLPPLLARWIAEHGDQCVHVSEIGLASASDREIWTYALANDAVIVSKDEDFVLLRAASAIGPQIVWVRIGNAASRVLLPRFESAWRSLKESLEQGRAVVELR
ncbi:MAG: DUF5615 family PIN-like protein [Beijerinckiaceae bacterium]|nr:DUF5615 family PIN-like protein [Beijerinckiaceae bacterium]